MPGVRGNRFALKHGGGAMIRAITYDLPTPVIVRGIENEVKAELAEPGGLESIIVKQATRLEVAARLYYDAMVKAGQDGDLDAMAAHSRTFGWLAGAALRAWALVRESKPSTFDPSKIIDNLVKGDARENHD